jgi:hypothetical protein
LELALRYKLEGSDLEARLRKGDQEAFSATINELACAKFLEALFGIDTLRWHPQGRKRQVGEFELVLTNLSKPIFVEVKTIVARELERMEKRIMDKLSRYTEEVDIPCCLRVTIRKLGDSEDFSGKRFKRFLGQELNKLNIKDTEKSDKLPDYSDDRTGLYLEIETLSIPRKSGLQSCHIGIIGGEARFVKDEDYIHHSLQKAYEKLREEQQPCLVLLCSSTGFSIDEDAMLNALLGTFAVHYQFITGVAVSTSEPETIRQPNGFYQSRKNRKLSASGVYQENITEEGIKSGLEIYHNPWAASPLDYSIFRGKGVRQLIKVGEGHTEWMD